MEAVGEGQRLGVLGGTFDPPHLAHLILAQEARWQLNLDRVLFVPAGLPWRKFDREVTAFEQRADMLRLALEGIEWAEVCGLEGERPGPSYTVDTLEELAGLYRARELVLILGEDAYQDLAHWKDPERIRTLACLAVAGRPVATVDPSNEPGVLSIAMPALAISSSQLRERVRLGQPLRFLVPDKVALRIEAAGHYRA